MYYTYTYTMVEIRMPPDPLPCLPSAPWTAASKREKRSELQGEALV